MSWVFTLVLTRLFESSDSIMSLRKLAPLLLLGSSTLGAATSEGVASHPGKIAPKVFIVSMVRIGAV